MTTDDHREGQRARHPDINRPDHVRGYHDAQSARLVSQAGGLAPVLIGAALLLALFVFLAWMLAALLPSMIAAFILALRTGRSYPSCVFTMVVATVALLFLFYSPCSLMGSSPTSLVLGLVSAVLGATFFGWIVERRIEDRSNLGLAIALVAALLLATTFGTLYSISTAFRYDLTCRVIHYFAPSLRDELPSIVGASTSSSCHDGTLAPLRRSRLTRRLAPCSRHADGASEPASCMSESIDRCTTHASSSGKATMNIHHTIDHPQECGWTRRR